MPHCRIALANRQAATLLGYTKRELTGMSVVTRSALSPAAKRKWLLPTILRGTVAP